MRAELQKRLRTASSFARKQGNKPQRALILIVCEDGKSSPAYFNDIRKRLRLSTADVQVYGEECGSAPMCVVEFAIAKANASRKDERPDRVFCVVDVDGHTTLNKARQRTEDFNRARKLAEDSEIEYIVSRPCFERWYLLHFEPGDRPYDSCDPLVKYVKKKHLREYDKGTFADFDVLWERMDIAIRNAKRLRENRNQDPGCTAYTNVDLVVEALRQVARG